MMRMIAQNDSTGHDTSRDVCIYKEDRRADEYRMFIPTEKKMDMDDVFMENYKVHVFSILPRLDSDWSFQVDNLHELWNTAADMINRAEFWLSFTSECFQFELPFEEYNIEEAFDKDEEGMERRIDDFSGGYDTEMV